MKKKWYEIIKELPFDVEPIIWFTMSGALILSGNWLLKDEKTAIGTLFIALGGAGITRVRGGRKPIESTNPPIPLR